MTSLLRKRLIDTSMLRCILSDITHGSKASARSISYTNSWCQSSTNGATSTQHDRRLLGAPKGPLFSRIQLEHSSSAAAGVRVKINVKTDKETITLEGNEGDSILDIVNDNNYDIPGYGACDGTIACSTCHVVLAENVYDGLSKRVTEEEKDLLDMVRDLKDTSDGSGRSFGAGQRCLTLAGCGFLAPYLLGSVICLARHHYWGLENEYTSIFPALKNTNSRLYEPDVEFDELKLSPLYVAGTSAGALLGAVIVAGSPSLQTVWDTFHQAAKDCSRLSLGPFNNDFIMEKYIRNCIEQLPEDVHLRVSGRLFVSITHMNSFSNRIVNEWYSREDLIQCLLCSCYLPVFSGGPVPEFRGERYIDGGFSNNLPTPVKPNLSISPFAGSSHICPHDLVQTPRFIKFANEKFLMSRPNLERAYHAFMPAEKVSFDELFLHGYLHAINYMKQKLTPSTK